MTTTVTIDTHAGWPVEIRQIIPAAFDDDAGLAYERAHPIIVPPLTVQSFYIHDGADLHIRELKTGG